MRPSVSCCIEERIRTNEGTSGTSHARKNVLLCTCIAVPCLLPADVPEREALSFEISHLTPVAHLSVPLISRFHTFNRIYLTEDNIRRLFNIPFDSSASLQTSDREATKFSKVCFVPGIRPLARWPSSADGFLEIKQK